MEQMRQTENVSLQRNGCGMTEEQYEFRLQKVRRSYLYLVIGCGTACASAIAVAVLASVMAGIFIAAATGIFYRAFLSDLLKKQLGIVCIRNADGLTVSMLRTTDFGNEFWVPDRLLWLDITEVGDMRGIQILHLPHTVLRVHTLVPAEEGGELRFAGNEQTWAAVQKDDSWKLWHMVYDADRSEEKQTR